MQVKIKNISNVEQDVVMTWVASNVLTYKNTFVEVRKILKGESLLITKKFETIPMYDLKIKLAVANTPFTFGGETPVIGSLTESTTLWIWNVVTYLTLIGILLFVGILFLLVKDLRRKSWEVVKATPTHKKKK